MFPQRVLWARDLTRQVYYAVRPKEFRLSASDPRLPGP